MDDEIDDMIKSTTAWSRVVHWFQFSDTWNLFIRPVLIGALTVTVITLAVVCGPCAWAWVHGHAGLTAVLATVGEIIAKVFIGALALVALWVIGILILLIHDEITNKFP